MCSYCWGFAILLFFFNNLLLGSFIFCSISFDFFPSTFCRFSIRKFQLEMYMDLMKNLNAWCICRFAWQLKWMLPLEQYFLFFFFIYIFILSFTFPFYVFSTTYTYTMLLFLLSLVAVRAFFIYFILLVLCSFENWMTCREAERRSFSRLR